MAEPTNHYQYLANETRRMKIREQYLDAVAEAAEAHLLASYGGHDGNTEFLRTRRALNVAVEQLRAKERVLQLKG